LAALIAAFSGHNFIATDLDATEVLAHLPSDDPGSALDPRFLAWLCQRLDAVTYTPDIVLAAFGCDADPEFRLVDRDDLEHHPRVQLARRYRSGVRVYSDGSGDGLITIARQRLGLQSISVEVEPAQRNRGLARKLVLAARSRIPEDEPLFASVSPGNAASVRAFLAAGYVPICSEVALLSRRDE
jgi:GNAT superfamily N-acetyltransferase